MGGQEHRRRGRIITESLGKGPGREGTLLATSRSDAEILARRCGHIVWGCFKSAAKETGNYVSKARTLST